MIAVGGVSHVVVVVPATHQAEFEQELRVVAQSTVRVTIVEGGAERSDSVRCGLRALDASCEVVLVHDAARALAPASLAERVVRALAAGADAVVPAMPVTDTIKVAEQVSRDENPNAGAERVVSTPSRSSLRAVQTPQGFRRLALVAAHESGADATDDAALIEQCGGDVRLVAGEVLAMKVTTPIDIVVAQHLLNDLTEAEPV